MFTDKIEAADFPKMPQEYQDLLNRVMTIQADSELGGPHLYVEQWILAAPTVEDQMMLAKTAAEEIDHHRKFAKILADLNVDVSHQIRNRRQERILEIFRYPLETWGDMGVFGTFVDRVGGYHLEDFSDCSYAPAARLVPQILLEEKQHIAHGLRILDRLCKTPEGKAEAQNSVNKMYPRCLDMFGKSSSQRSDKFVEWGIKKRTNAECREQYRAESLKVIEQFGLQEPDPTKGRRYV